MLAYTKNLAAYTKLSSENQQVKLQCMQCMQKLKIKIVKGEHFLCPPFGYQMMWKLFFLIGWRGIRHQTQQQFEYMLIALGIDTTEMLNCPIPKRWPLVIDKDTRIHFLSSIAKLWRRFYTCKRVQQIRYKMKHVVRKWRCYQFGCSFYSFHKKILLSYAISGTIPLYRCIKPMFF